MSTARTPCNGRGGQRGAVLVLVLWILTLLTFLLGAFSNEIRVENRIVGDMVERIRLRAGATAVLNYLALAGTASPEGRKMMLLGLTSRWMTCCRCRSSSAVAILVPRAATSS